MNILGLDYGERYIGSKFNLKVSKVDERMTSTIITSSNKERIDDISALQILETYLANV